MVIFIGGIHGSGKGTLCEKISKNTQIPHFTASDLIKWEEVSPDLKNKKVIDIQYTQERLIMGLNSVRTQHQSFILDGHFCLFNSEGQIDKISINTFETIAPNYIVFVSANPEEIRERLIMRDGMEYSTDILNEMQDIEFEYSKEVAESLKIPFFHLNENNLPEFLLTITSKK